MRETLKLEEVMGKKNALQRALLGNIEINQACRIILIVNNPQRGPPQKKKDRIFHETNEGKIKIVHETRRVAMLNEGRLFIFKNFNHRKKIIINLDPHGGENAGISRFL